MNEIVFILTKDCLSIESLPIYGNKIFHTPNIDELANKGTVYRRHYASAASTAMSITAMLSGCYPYEFKSRKNYTAVIPSEHPSLFDYFQSKDYETHLIWDKLWMDMAWPYIREFGDEGRLILHNLDICQPTGGGKTNDEIIVRNDELLSKTILQIKNVLSGIDTTKAQFVWMHLPHVLKGRRCYMDDMEAFDEIVGIVRDFAGDENIIISTDHGHMNMHKGEVGYGFNVYEPVIHIPLITPRMNELKEVNYLTSNVDIPKYILSGIMPEREFVIAETQYFGQPKRVTAIIKNNLKYIYNKETKREELYDLWWDPYENYNILVDGYFDTNRKKYLLYDEYYYYPQRAESIEQLDGFRKIKDSFWDDLTEDEYRILNRSIRKQRIKDILNKILGK